MFSKIILDVDYEFLVNFTKKKNNSILNLGTQNFFILFGYLDT